MATPRSRRTTGCPLKPVVRAAGGVVVVQGSDGALSVLVVHRPAYDDWSFPKGKAEPGETDEDCALREVEEETGLVCELARELASTDYLDGKRRPKRVRYWLMTVIGGALRFDFEVDQARWVSVSDAAELLTYERDVALLESL